MCSAVQLTTSHVADAFTLSSLAGWNQTLEDWQMLLRLSDACYGIELDGQLVATATLVCYGQTLAWLGMVLTHPDFRRRGFARTLVDHALRHAKSLEIETVGLDATPDGQPLYETFGFHPIERVERWERQPHSGSSNSLPSDVSHDGYVLERPGRLRRYLGPCVANSPATARALIETTVTRKPDNGWFWDLLPANHDAVSIATDLGFKRARTLTRMSWGRELPTNNQRIFAIAGLELG